MERIGLVCNFFIMSGSNFNDRDGVPRVTVQDISGATIINNVKTLIYPSAISDLWNSGNGLFLI